MQLLAMRVIDSSVYAVVHNDAIVPSTGRLSHKAQRKINVVSLQGFVRFNDGDFTF